MVTSARNKSWLCSRRAFFGGLGAVGACHLLTSGRISHAQLSTNKRFVVVYVPEGMWSGAARPSAGASFGEVFGPLDPFRDRITALDGLDNATAAADRPGVDEHHRLPHLLGCVDMVDGVTGGGPTLDQVIAKLIGGDSTFESLQFGVQRVYTDGSGKLIWKDRSQQLPPMEDPWEAYNRIFGEQVDPGGGAPPKFDLRKSALDYSLTEIANVAPRLATSDRLRIDSYQESLRDIERRLSGLQPGGQACTPPELGSPIDVDSKANFPAVSQLQMDLLVASLQCGATNVASLQFGNSVDQCTYPWLGIGNKTGHDLAHENRPREKTDVYNWYSQQFAYLMGKLDAIPEGAGTMLDNTVILWVSEFGDSSAHSLRNVVWWLMGNVGGFLRQGQVLKLDGRSTSDVHVTIANAFGIPDQVFGKPEFCDGPITDLIA